MTIALAIEYIPRRMRDLGVGDAYYIRFRHYVLQANELLNIDAENQFYILVEEVVDIIIDSDASPYDLSNDSLNEQNYEHQGSISIWNTSSSLKHVRFIHVIPINAELPIN